MAILLDFIEVLNFYKKIIFFIYDRIVRKIRSMWYCKYYELKLMIYANLLHRNSNDAEFTKSKNEKTQVVVCGCVWGYAWLWR